MSHDTDDWCKIWRKANLLFQNWQEFREFWSEYCKVSKICTLINPFCAKYIIFDLKKYRGVIFHDTEESFKILRKARLWFEKWYEDFSKFSPEHSKSQKCALQWAVFDQSTKCSSWKSTEELCLIALNVDAKFEEKMTCAFKNDMRNLANFHKSTFGSLKIWTFIGSFHPK